MLQKGILKVNGNLVDLVNNRIFHAEISIADGIITAVEETTPNSACFILPGFVDAHVHIESSMLIPSSFAQTAVTHGTVATVSDPHEIANVLGVPGIDFMIENGKTVPLKFFFGAPSCVPATPFEAAGAVIDADEIGRLLSRPDIYYLAEMMNYPGVIYKDPQVMAKLHFAQKYKKVIDGHAPGLRGSELQNYISAGISSDHECFTFEEAQEKAQAGMKILIREGSAAKNYAALIPLINKYPDQIMFCSDDKHPDDLINGHINKIVSRAIKDGYDLFSVIKAATANPIEHYNLNVGMLRVGDPADLITVDNLHNFNVCETYIDGQLVAQNGRSRIEISTVNPLNNFNCRAIDEKQLKVKAEPGTHIRVIEVLPGELITKEKICPAKIEGGCLVSDLDSDLLQLVVINRYQESKAATGFVTGFGMKQGALASSVAHDSHNIVAIGANRADLIKATNLVIQQQGGIAIASGHHTTILPLPIAGLMSDSTAQAVAKEYQQLDRSAKELGCTSPAPFMTLSFLALLVIPELKLGDRGLFDGRKFEFTQLIVQ